MFVIIEPPSLSAYLIEWKETSYCYNNVPVYIERESLHFHNFWPFHYVVYFYFTARLIPEPFSWSLQQLSQSGFEWVPLHQDDPRDCTLQFHPPHSNDKQKVKGNVNNTSLKITIIFPNQLGSINLWWLCLDIAEINLKWCFINPCLYKQFFLETAHVLITRSPFYL